MKNHLYTKSYFIKRLKDNGYYVHSLYKFHDLDKRKWLIVIDKDASILCTCYKIDKDNFWFKFDCMQKSNIIVQTLSMAIIFDTVDKLIDGCKEMIQ
jgi:hypothetical protein